MPAYGAWPGVAIQKCRTVNCHGNHNLIYACILIYAIYAVFGRSDQEMIITHHSHLKTLSSSVTTDFSYRLGKLRKKIQLHAI